MRATPLVLVLVVAGCTEARPAPDAGSALDTGRDAGAVALSTEDGARADTPAPPPDAELSADLAAERERLLTTLGSPCARWAALSPSARAVFLTITHRLSTSITPDGRSMLSHVVGLVAVLGGGADGTECGGVENNRVFLSTDAYLHGLLVDTWNHLTPIADGAGSTWIHTRDVGGPHDPFDASDETDTGLRCVLLFESGDSRPPTAQVHFFLGAPVAFTRGTVTLPADPFLLEIDQDYNCVHDSNPTCRDFADRYTANHGDFDCAWVPAACTPVGSGCYREVMP